MKQQAARVNARALVDIVMRPASANVLSTISRNSSETSATPRQRLAPTYVFASGHRAKWVTSLEGAALEERKKFFRAIVNAVNRAFVIHIHYRSPLPWRVGTRGRPDLGPYEKPLLSPTGRIESVMRRFARAFSGVRANKRASEQRAHVRL